MGPGARLVVVAWLAVAGAGAAVDKTFNITVGYLPSLTGELRDRQGLTISGALTIALEELNNSTEILPDVKILLEWHDTKSDTVTATRLLTDMSCSGVVAFFGPEGRCHTEAIIAQSRNLPMISYKCSDYRTSKLSNFVRLEPSGAQAARSVISLLGYYRWNKFSILYEESWEMVAMTLENYAMTNNMTINHKRPVIDVFKCCEEKLTCCKSDFWYKFIQETKNKTRIYVFLGSSNELIDMMSAMESHQLFANGEYMVIFVDLMAYMPKQALGYLIKTEDRYTPICPNTPEFKKRAQSLLVVVSSEPTSNYQNFTDKVRKYNKAEPFKFPESKIVIGHIGVNKFVSIYAAYLYDSAKIYATALDDLIKEDTQNETLSYAKLMRIANNGSRIVAKLIERSPYKSVSGMSIRLDEHADSEGNFSVLAFKPARQSDVGINCSHNMIPVGHFQQNERLYPEYKLNPRLPIDWAGNLKPEDEPSLGSDNGIHLYIVLTATFITLCQRMLKI